MKLEFSRRYLLDSIGSDVRRVTIAANSEECASLAHRFALMALDSLNATATLAAGAEGIESRGVMHAIVVQACVVQMRTSVPPPASVNGVAGLRRAYTSFTT